MLKKLRVKFVVLLMAAVAVVMTALFAAICAISWQQSVGELNDALGDVLEEVAECADASDATDSFLYDGAREGRRGRELGRHRDEQDLFERSGPVAIYLYENGVFTPLSFYGVQVGAEALVQAAAAIPEGRDAEGLLDEFDLAWREEVAVAPLTSDVDFSRVVQHELLQFESVAYERGLRFEEAVQEGLFVSMSTDDARRLVDVLLDNACKYADRGSVVRVALEAAPPAKRASSAVVRLTVANTGDAAAPEDLPRLFDRFYRADAARTSHEGHGLGLSIAKTLVEAAGGTIAARSEARETTFTVELPRALAF